MHTKKLLLLLLVLMAFAIVGCGEIAAADTIGTDEVAGVVYRTPT